MILDAPKKLLYLGKQGRRCCMERIVGNLVGSEQSMSVD